MILQKSFKLLKKNFHLLFLLEMGFWFSLLFFLVYIKNKLLSYLALFTTFAPQLTALGQAAEQNTLDNLDALQMLTLLEGVTKEALFFAYGIVPVGLVVIWCVFQSLSWYVIKEGKVKRFSQFFVKFSFSSVVVFGFAYLFIRSIFAKTFETIPLDTAMLQVVGIAFVVLYVLITFYACLDSNSLQQTLRKCWRVTTRHFHKIVLPYLLFFIMIGASAFMFFSLFVSYTTGNFFLLPAIPLVVYFLLFLIVGLLVKVFINCKIEEIK